MKALKTKTLNLKDIEITDEFWKVELIWQRISSFHISGTH